MNASFVSTSWPPTSSSTPTDATAHHAAFPRPVRKTLRLSTQRTMPTNNASALPEAVDNFLRTEYRSAPDFWVNLETAGEHADDFHDVDNEYDGLTITDPITNDADLWRFCTGYDVL